MSCSELNIVLHLLSTEYFFLFLKNIPSYSHSTPVFPHSVVKKTFERESVAKLVKPKEAGQDKRKVERADSEHTELFFTGGKRMHAEKKREKERKKKNV